MVAITPLILVISYIPSLMPDFIFIISPIIGLNPVDGNELPNVSSSP